MITEMTTSKIYIKILQAVKKNKFVWKIWWSQCEINK